MTSTRLRFLLDQSADARLVGFLRSMGHDAERIGADHPPGLPDSDVLAISRREGRILVTDDRDFGELVVQRRHKHAGVIYLRLGDAATLATRFDRLSHVLNEFADRLDQFLVVTRHRVRVRGASSDD